MRATRVQESGAHGNPASQVAEMLPPQSPSKSPFSLADPWGAEMKVRAETQQGFRCPEYAGELKLELLDTGVFNWFRL